MKGEVDKGAKEVAYLESLASSYLKPLKQAIEDKPKKAKKRKTVTAD
jgi:hypothetical protein